MVPMVQVGAKFKELGAEHGRYSKRKIEEVNKAHVQVTQSCAKRKKQLDQIRHQLERDFNREVQARAAEDTKAWQRLHKQAREAKSKISAHGADVRRRGGALVKKSKERMQARRANGGEGGGGQSWGQLEGLMRSMMSQ